MQFSEFCKKHQILVAGGIAILLALVCWGAYALFSTPKPKSEKPEDLARFVASGSFRRLSPDQQQHYMEQLRQANAGRANPRQMRETMQQLSESERRTMFENMRRVREKERAKEALAYLQMSQAEKNAYLDQKIAEFDRRHAEMAKRRAQREKERKAQGNRQQQNARANGQQSPQNAQANGQQPQQNAQRPNFAQMRKTHMESTPPEVRAARATIMRDMMARRKATGKPMPTRR